MKTSEPITSTCSVSLLTIAFELFRDNKYIISSIYVPISNAS